MTVSIKYLETCGDIICRNIQKCCYLFSLPVFTRFIPPVHYLWTYYTIRKFSLESPVVALEVLKTTVHWLHSLPALQSFSGVRTSLKIILRGPSSDCFRRSLDRWQKIWKCHFLLTLKFVVKEQAPFQLWRVCKDFFVSKVDRPCVSAIGQGIALLMHQSVPAVLMPSRGH